MTWTKLSDAFIDDPELLALPRGIRLLAVEALCWSNRHGTDGAIERHVLARLTDEPDPVAAADQLVDAGLWAPTAAGWSVVGFLDDQPAATDVKKARELAVARTKRWNLHRQGDHSLCRPSYCKRAPRHGSIDASIDGGADASIDGLTSRPTRPARNGEGGTGEIEDGRTAAAIPAAPPPSDEQLQEWAKSDEPMVRAVAEKALAQRKAGGDSQPVARPRPRLVEPDPIDEEPDDEELALAAIIESGGVV